MTFKLDLALTIYCFIFLYFSVITLGLIDDTALDNDTSYANSKRNQMAVSDIEWNSDSINLDNGTNLHNLIFNIDSQSNQMMAVWQNNGIIIIQRSNILTNILDLDRWDQTSIDFGTVLYLDTDVSNIVQMGNYSGDYHLDLEVNCQTHVWILMLTINLSTNNTVNSEIVLMLMSSDFGETWSQLYRSTGSSNIEHLSIRSSSYKTVTRAGTGDHHNNWIASWTHNGTITIIQSNNNGNSWLELPSPSNIYNTGNIDWNSCYGVSFEPMYPSNDHDIDFLGWVFFTRCWESSVYLIDLTFNLYVNISYSEEPYILSRSTDLPLQKLSTDHSYNPGNKKGDVYVLVVITTDGSFYRSTDYGSTWSKRLDIIRTYTDLIYSGNNNWYASVASNKLYNVWSDDNGKYWKEEAISGTSNSNSCQSVSINDKVWIYMYGDDNNIYGIIGTLPSLNITDLYNELDCDLLGHCIIQPNIKIDLSQTEINITGDFYLDSGSELVLHQTSLRIGNNLTFSSNDTLIKLIDLDKPIVIGSCFNPSGKLVLEGNYTDDTLFSYSCWSGSEFDEIVIQDVARNNTNSTCRPEIIYGQLTTIFGIYCDQNIEDENSILDSDHQTINLVMIIIISSGVVLSIIVILLSLYVFRYTIFPYRARLEKNIDVSSSYK